MSLVDQMINEVDVVGYGSSSANPCGNEKILIAYNGTDYEEKADDQWTMIIYSSPSEYEIRGITEELARTLLD